MAAYAFNPNTWKAEVGRYLWVETSWEFQENFKKKKRKRIEGSKGKEKMLATNSYSIILISKTHIMEKENHSLASYPLIPAPLHLHTLCNYFKI